MPRYFAEINSLTNEVIRVIVCNDKNWCETNLGGIWIETYKYSSDKKCAGKGMIYYQDKDNFASKQPYPSWTLDENCDWQPPIVIPNLTEEDKDNNKYYYCLKTLLLSSSSKSLHCVITSLGSVN